MIKVVYEWIIDLFGKDIPRRTLTNEIVEDSIKNLKTKLKNQTNYKINTTEAKDDLEICFQAIFALNPQTTDNNIMDNTLLREDNNDKNNDINIDSNDYALEEQIGMAPNNDNIILHVLSTKDVIIYSLQVLSEKYLIALMNCC